MAQRQNGFVGLTYDTLRDLGCRDLGHSYTGKGHVKVTFTTAEGRTGMVFLSQNSGDPRAAKNAVTSARKAVKQANDKPLREAA